MTQRSDSEAKRGKNRSLAERLRAHPWLSASMVRLLKVVENPGARLALSRFWPTAGARPKHRRVGNCGPTPTKALSIGKVALCLLFTAATSAASAQAPLGSGHDWIASSEEARVAYILGISNLVTALYAHDEKTAPEAQDTFSHQAAKGFQGTTVMEAVNRVDAWYRANPTQLDTPVLRVLWVDIVKPRLVKSK